jgi:hypothetical protein
MFQQRQLNDVYQQMEVSVTAPTTPGTITGGAGQHIAPVPCTIGSSGSPEAAQFALGDVLEVIANTNAGNIAGLQIVAWPTATPGTCILGYQNATAGSITPVANSTYTIIAKRITTQLI